MAVYRIRNTPLQKVSIAATRCRIVKRLGNVFTIVHFLAVDATQLLSIGTVFFFFFFYYSFGSLACSSERYADLSLSVVIETFYLVVTTPYRISADRKRILGRSIFIVQVSMILKYSTPTYRYYLQSRLSFQSDVILMKNLFTRDIADMSIKDLIHT